MQERQQAERPWKARVQFWGKALLRGLGLVNAAAGWLGMVLLVAGAAAGIVLPVVYHWPHWVTALVLLALLVIVMAEGSYRTSVEAEQSAAQQVALGKQAEVLNLQHAQLQQGAVDRRRAQAARIVIQLDRGSDLGVTQAQVASGVVRGDIITAEVTNTSDLPAYDCQLHWVDENGDLLQITINPEPLPNLMPHASETRTRRVPPGTDASRFFAVVRFRDADEVAWERDMAGRLKEITAETQQTMP